MSGPGIVTLASLRFQAQERADQLNSSFLSVSEWNRNIATSWKRLYNLLIAAYGCDYYVTKPLTFVTNGTSYLYPLPDGTTTFTDAISGATVTPTAFFKLLGVDLQLSPSVGSSSPSNSQSYVTIWGFTFADRNRFAVPNFQSFYGITNLRVRLQGNNLWFTPIPSAGQTIQLWQVPRPLDLQPEAIVGLTSGNTTVTCTDTSNLTNGMFIQYPTAAFAAGTTISGIVANTSFTVSNAPTITNASALCRFWNDGTSVDGIAGWEEYVVCDAAAKASAKEESDGMTAELKQCVAKMEKELIDMAENRNLSQPATVVDKQYADFWMPGNAGGSGQGGGY